VQDSACKYVLHTQQYQLVNSSFIDALQNHAWINTSRIILAVQLNPVVAPIMLRHSGFLQVVSTAKAHNA